MSHPSTTATTAVSLQTTVTSTGSQSTLGHVTVSPSVGDASQSTSSISTAAGELEAVINQVFPGSITAIPQGPVTGDVLTTDPTSGPQGSINTAASAAQQLSAIPTDNNQCQVIAQIHAEDKASQSADSANPFPGLPAVSANDVEAVMDSGVAPTPNLNTVAIDFTVGHQLSNLQLSGELGSGSAPGTRQFAVGSGLGPGPGTGDVPLPVTDQQGQLSTEPTNPGAITHTGIDLNATQSANSTQQGFESAAATFHGNIEPPKALILGAQPAGPAYEAEMPEDGDRQDRTAMDDSNAQTDTHHPSTSANQQSANLSATVQPVPAVTFDPDVIANLVQAAAAGQFWDAPGPLKGATAAQMQELQAVLQKMASNQKLTETDLNKDESGPEGEIICVRRTSESASTSSDSSPDSSSSSDSDSSSGTVSQVGTSQKQK